MEQKDIQKVYNGDAMVFSKQKFWIAQIITILIFAGLWLGTFLWWGGGLQATVKTHIESKEIHETATQKNQRVSGLLKDYMRSNLIDTKFENLKEDVKEIKSDLKEIKHLLQNK